MNKENFMRSGGNIPSNWRNHTTTGKSDESTGSNMRRSEIPSNWRNNATTGKSDENGWSDIHSNNYRTNHRAVKLSQDKLQVATEELTNRSSWKKHRRGTGRRPVFLNYDQHEYFDIIRLSELSGENNDIILLTLNEKKDEFGELMQNFDKFSCNAPDLSTVTLQILAKICCPDSDEISTSVLSQACCPQFFKSLESYLTKLPFENSSEKIKNQLYHTDKDKFWFNLIEVFKKIKEVFPTKAREELTSILRKVIRVADTIAITQDYKLNEKIKTEAENMYKDVSLEIKRIEEINRSSKNTSEQLNENFRHLSVVPRLTDLSDGELFVRPCKIKDAYDSIEQYLDIQFRLLREDFLSPLRTGLRDYLNKVHKQQNNEVRIYRKVKLLAPVIHQNDSGFEIFFGEMKHVEWHHSKRLMQKGLVILSNDNFKTAVFATIILREIKDLQRGCVVIEPCLGSVITQAMYGTNFVMLESKVYFEPYQSVLNALKQFNAQNFPMETYLIHADKSKRLPKYLVDEQSLKFKVNSGSLNLPIESNRSWPSATQLGLDESQYKAFRCALTEELAIIQGPPGTGKTFIALKIVSTLLMNKSLWKSRGPIVVVCLTNHALDQFLEGILKHTDSIVRLGSRSKSETLARFNLKCRYYKLLNRFAEEPPAISLIRSKENELKNIVRRMEETQSYLEYLTTSNFIVPLACLKKYCFDETFTNINFGFFDEKIINWLLASWLTESKTLSEMESLADELEDIVYASKSNKLSKRIGIPEPECLLTRIDYLIERINIDMIYYRASEMSTLPFNPLFYEFLELEENLEDLKALKSSLQNEFQQHPILNRPLRQSNNPRWLLYWNWVDASYRNALVELPKMEGLYNEIKNEYNEARQLADLEVLKLHDIVGMTTTRASNLRTTLNNLRAPIVVVEEAAEILESHVVCSLTKDTQHVILIGDHKQLRPKASVYELGKYFNLNISLFERMVKIKGDCVQLESQHRMRPEISKLITPSIYEKLHNHESVYSYPEIKGLEKSLFFLNHNNKESHLQNEESWINPHEAKFLVRFAEHLLKQGYKATEITILCTYTDQLLVLQKEARRHSMLKDVAITTVDNYQGEENRIILLSLVRNNGEGNIGFLKEENRVCVALSRAREGLYIMGNMDDLIVGNRIWPKIKQVLESENAISSSLELRCQNHFDQVTLIKNVDDFEQCREGGCSKICNADLPCGHSCLSMCHIINRQHHEKYQCKQKCTKSCPENHPCPLRCNDLCPPCEVTVNVTLPDCKHDNEKFCYLPIEEYNCSYPCGSILSCSHICPLNCHVKTDPLHIEYKCIQKCKRNYADCNHLCSKKCHEECGSCTTLVEKQRSCGHYYKEVSCSVNVEKLSCEKPCKRNITACGHRCRLKCSEICGNCLEKVEKMSSCGHVLEVECSEEATASKCNEKCRKILPCGHLCTKKCKEECTSICKYMVPLAEPGLCGHTFSVPCGYSTMNAPKSSELLKYCKEPCQAQLLCGHICGGTCGQCKQGRFHIPCAKPCDKILICGHKCDQLCSKECQPCQKKCEFKCIHTKCNKKCGVPCKECKKPCDRKCKHKQCKKMCYELCDIDPCDEPCERLLKCKHTCIGFCGDPCPPLCRICHVDELINGFCSEHEEDRNASRFVFLEDCKHCVESKWLLEWLSQSKDLIGMKTCPRCKVPIMNCKRLRSVIKKDLEDVQVVKKEVFVDDYVASEKQQIENLAIARSLMNNPRVQEFSALGNLLLNLCIQGTSRKKTGKKRQQHLNFREIREVEDFKIILNILEQMFDALSIIEDQTVDFYKFIKYQITVLVEALPIKWQITDQLLDDIQLELHRLYYMSKLCEISVRFNDSSSDNQNNITIAEDKVLGLCRFTKKVEEEVQRIINGLGDINFMIKQQYIVKPVGFTQGHWYKCPHGHFSILDFCDICGVLAANV